jgi:hypothetical protein
MKQFPYIFHRFSTLYLRPHDAGAPAAGWRLPAVLHVLKGLFVTEIYGCYSRSQRLLRE